MTNATSGSISAAPPGPTAGTAFGTNGGPMSWKLLPHALYVHYTAVGHLPPVLRVYEGCARQLAGAVDGLTLVKLFRRRPRVSYLAYDDFDRVAHPALKSTVVADLKGLDLHHRDYTRSANPPVLHRKELFVAADHPARERFARLTAREDRLGLLDATSGIGTRAGWLAVLAAAACPSADTASCAT